MALDDFDQRMQARQTDELRRLLEASSNPLDQRALATDPKFMMATDPSPAMPDLSTMPDPRAPQSQFDQNSFQQSLAPGTNFMVNEPQALPGVLPVSDAQQQADEFKEFFSSLPLGMRLGIAEQGGLPSLANQFMQQRQSAAQKQMEMVAQQKKGQMDQAFKVFLDHNTPWSARSKALAQMGDPYSMSLSRIGSEQIASNFAMAHPYLDDEFKQQWEQDPSAIPPAVVEAHLKQAMGRAEKDQQFQLENKRTEDIRQRVLNNKPVTLEEAKHLQKVLKEQAELPLQLEQLRSQIASTQQETRIKGERPSEAFSARGPAGEIVTGIYDPKTGKTTERVGQPLQRVEQSIMPAGMLKERSEIQSSVDQLKATADLFHPDFVGTIDTMKNAILRTLNMPITAKRKDTKTGETKTVREEDFRFAYDMLQKVLRKTLMGTAQSVQELSANPLAFPSASDKDADVTVPAFLRGQYRNLVQQLEAQDKVMDARMRASPQAFAMRYRQLKQMAATTDSSGRNALGFKSGDDMDAAIAERLAEEMQRGWITP